jgi:mono/diheme cytochrome c family protein
MNRTYHKSRKYALLFCAIFSLIIVVAVSSCKKTGDQAAPGMLKDSTAKAAMTPAERGKYLVAIASCNDCHTPLKMGPQGPEPDMSRMLAGHPAEMKMPPAPKMDMPWMAAGAATLTAWAGPWGISYTANLTPDSATGLGKWDETTFMLAIRNGKHIGTGRDILPPMPWQWIKQMTDEDLKAVYAYLRTIPAVHNQVPDAVVAPPPPGMGGAPGAGKK